MTTPTTTARRKKLLRPAKDKTPSETGLDVDVVEVVTEATPDTGGNHLADFVVPEIDDDANDLDAPVHVEAIAEQAAAKVELIGQDAFFTVFKTVFSIPQFVQPDLAALAVQPEEESTARAASDATYALLKIYYPAALTPKGEVFGHLMIVGPFLVLKAVIVREVIRARRAKPANPPQEPPAAVMPTPQTPAANDNWPVDMDAVEIPETAA